MVLQNNLCFLVWDDVDKDVIFIVLIICSMISNQGTIAIVFILLFIRSRFKGCCCFRGARGGASRWDCPIERLDLDYYHRPLTIRSCESCDGVIWGGLSFREVVFRLGSCWVGCVEGSSFILVDGGQGWTDVGFWLDSGWGVAGGTSAGGPGGALDWEWGEQRIVLRLVCAALLI